MIIFQERMEKLKMQNIHRELSISHGIDFCSNDYLGFAREKMYFKSYEINNGSASSRLISTQLHDHLFNCEDYIQKVFNAPSALLFGSGYLANIGVIQSFSSLEEVHFFSDELIHASFIDGMKMSQHSKTIFRHNDLNHLEKLLSQSSKKIKVIVTESIFSMDGDGPDLLNLVFLAEKFNALLIVDEAHATGVLGLNGLGLMENIPFNWDRTIIIHTCSKALGAYGAFVTSGLPVRELMVNFSRSLIYSTALPPVLTFQIKNALKKILDQKTHHKRSVIKENILFAKNYFKKINIDLKGDHICFVPLQNFQDFNLLEFNYQMKINCLQIKVIRSPSVPKKSERLRVTLKSFNTFSEIQLLANTIHKLKGVN